MSWRIFKDGDDWKFRIEVENDDGHTIVEMILPEGGFRDEDENFDLLSIGPGRWQRCSIELDTEDHVITIVGAQGFPHYHPRVKHGDDPFITVPSIDLELPEESFKSLVTYISSIPKLYDAHYDFYQNNVNNRPDPNQLREFEYRFVEDLSALMIAVEEGSLDIVEHLLATGADVNQKNARNETPLFIAADEGHIAIVERLLAAGAEVNVKNSENYTPLMAATSEGHLEIVQRLLAAGADVNAEDNSKDTPLLIAVTEKYTSIVEHLLAAGANTEAKNIPNETALIIAADHGNTEIVELLLNNGANVNVENDEKNTPLILAAKNGSTTIVERLLARGANPNVKNNKNQSALMFAAEKGYIAVVEYLIAAGADVNVKDNFNAVPLGYAAFEGHTAIVDRLLAAGAEKEVKNVHGLTPLMLAMEKGHTTIVEHLIAAGANVNAENNNKNTPLTIAAVQGHTAIVERLIAAGANVNAETNEKNTPLTLAAVQGHTAIVERLIAAGVNVNAENNNKNTPLILAAFQGHTAIVERLIAAGANVNAETNKKDTPLIIAASYGHTAIVERLISAGADPTKKNKDDKTALDFAREKGNHYLIRLLTPKWKGFSRSDIELLNHVFETAAPAGGGRPDAENVSCCPVCFKYVDLRASPQIVSRASGCMYILNHNCSTAGGYYHTELYNKYKNPDGTICWCTICGRICQRTPHAHYDLVLAKSPKAGLLAHLGDPFGGEADCIKDGGGGLMEKLARYRRMREFAAQLQKQIDKMTFDEALDKLIEQTWNAPLFENLNLPNIASSGTWNISPEVFPNIRPEIPAPVAAPDVPWSFSGRPSLMPYIGPPQTNNNATNTISMNELTTVIKLKHPKLDGDGNVIILTHPAIGIHSLFEKDTYNKYAADIPGQFGRCFFSDDTGCPAIIYPDELQYILDAHNEEALTAEKRAEYQEKIDVYRQRFNETYRNNAEFKARIDADVKTAAAMPAGGAGVAAGQGGGKRNRRTTLRRRKNRSRRVRS